MLEKLRAELGDGAVRAGEDTAFRVHGVAPAAVVAPADAAQAAVALRLCADHHWTVRPAGAGTWLHAGQHTRADVVLTTAQMRGIFEYEPADLMVGVAAGTSLSELDAELKPHGQFFAVQPPADPAANVGAAIATASAGPLRLGFGTPRDHVLGVRLVTGDGRVLDLGGRVVKNVAGYDLVRLVVGSDGTLGIITRAFLRLKPRPARDITALFRADSPERLVRIALALDVGWPVAVELIDPATAAELSDNGIGRWTLAARWHGNSSFAEYIENRLARHATEAPEILPTDRAESLWNGLARLEAHATAAFRLVALPDRLNDLLAAATALTGVHGSHNPQSDNELHDPLGIRWRLAAHARSGVVRVWSDTAGPAHTEALLERYLSVRQNLAESSGVTASTPVLPGTNAIGTEVRRRRTQAALAAESPGAAHAPESEAVMRIRAGIRLAFDPMGTLAAARTADPEEIR